MTDLEKLARDVLRIPETKPALDIAPPNPPIRHTDRRVQACIDVALFGFSTEEHGELWHKILFGTYTEREAAIDEFGEAVREALQPLES